MIYPKVISQALDMAIAGAVIQRGEFVKDMGEFTRKRKLPLETVIKLLLSMDGGSLKKELYKSRISVTPSAFVQQRSKISSNLFRQILQDFNRNCTDTATYKGYRVLAVDGTSINMARNPNAPSFVSYEGNPTAGYNQMFLTPLYDLCSMTYYDAVVTPKPRADEIGSLIAMLYRNDFEGKNIIVADRGYESYNVFAHLLNHGGVDFLIRVKQDRSAMREIKKLPMMELDTDVSFTITTTQTNEDKQKGHILMQVPKKDGKMRKPQSRARWDFGHINPYPMKLRVVRFILDTGEYETLATSLPRSSFTIEDLKIFYHLRWGVETSFRLLKYCQLLVNLHEKKDEFVKQEIYSALTMYNFCSRIANSVVIEQKDTNIHEYKVNFTMAIYLCREFYRNPNADGSKLMRDIARYTEPIRLGRADERNLKAKSFAGFTYRVST